MAINNGYTNLARTISHLKNPNLQTGTLLIELPADVGRAYSGYKRGGIVEASEKFRKEVMSAVVWLFGIPVFNKAGNMLCEKLLKIPMDIDYSNADKGTDSIKNTIEFLKTGRADKNADTSEIAKYLKNSQLIKKLKDTDTEKILKQIKGAKQIISFASLGLNCFLMGIALPKINQKLTKDKLEKNKKSEYTPKFETIEEYQNKTRKNNVSFTGFIDWVTYGVNNNNTFRLVSTDLPMIAGRCATARNKYEAMEIAFIDGASIYFYNFCLGHIEKLMRKINKTPDINPKIAELIAKQDPRTIQGAIEKINPEAKNIKIKDLFNEDLQKQIYKEATYGKYGKINRFVKNQDLEAIDNIVVKFLEEIKNKNFIKNGTIDTQELGKYIKNSNKKNAIFYAIGSIISMLGLGILVPKAGYALTKHITGNSGFIGIADIKDENVKKN